MFGLEPIQTGSGKTFTMEGPEDNSSPVSLESCDDDRRGMIPRAVEQVFITSSELREKGWEVRKLGIRKLRMSFYVMYM